MVSLLSSGRDQVVHTYYGRQTNCLSGAFAVLAWALLESVVFITRIKLSLFCCVLNSVV